MIWLWILALTAAFFFGFIVASLLCGIDR